MKKLDSIELAKDIIAVPSVSRWSNVEVSDLLQNRLIQLGFEVERLSYIDDNQEEKVSLVAKIGQGRGGFALFSHSDTVPGQEQDWAAFNPVVEGGHLIGRGSCDMKGPLAATIIASTTVNVPQLKCPVYVVVTADEEVGSGGATQVARESTLFRNDGPTHGIIAEPTELAPVYAHKGGCHIVVTAYGEAAHTSTDRGISANFLMAPFLAEMAELAKVVKEDESFRNYEFNPPTPGFNMRLNDGGGPTNVTAAKTTCTISFRTMPDDRADDLCSIIRTKAEGYSLEVSSRLGSPFYTSPDGKLVQTASHVTGQQPKTVPFGTDAFALQDSIELVVLGPGNIAQAHTVGEWITVEQMHQAEVIYRQMIEAFCF